MDIPGYVEVGGRRMNIRTFNQCHERLCEVYEYVVMTVSIFRHFFCIEEEVAEESIQSSLVH